MFRCSLVLAVLVSTGAAVAQTSYPMLMSLKPAAAQVGQTSEHELESRYSMFGAYQVLVSGEGVTGEVVTPMELDKEGKEPSLTKIKLSFTVEAGALPGVRDFRVIGPTGASTLGQLVIVTQPIVSETDSNDSPETAQEVSVPATLCGTIEKAEDVDCYRFTLAEPTPLTFHCLSMRLQDKIHDLQQHADPILTVKNAATGATVAAADNTYAADPFLSHEFAGGDYVLLVRDSRYQGNRYWEYSIEVSDQPFVAQVHPLAVSPGATVDLSPVGAFLPESQAVSFAVPMEETGPRDVQLPMGESVTNPVSLVVTDLPTAIEAEGENGTAETAQAVTAPVAISGRIEAPADIDCYRFSAIKGQRYSFEVVARRYWSSLDSIIRILDADGKQLTENDDLRLWGKRTYQDSQIEFWAPPADGEYVVEIRDVHLRGGDAFVYMLKIEPTEPTFELVLDSDKTWLTPGTCAALFARVVRKNGFDGEVQLHVEGLPAGVTAQAGRILAGKGQDGCIVFEAAADAELSAANITVYGTAQHQVDESTTLELKTVAQSMQETYMPGGGRNHWPVGMHTLAVGKPSDIRSLTLSTYEVSLKPGESAKIEVEIERAPGFDKNITLDLLFQHLSSVYADTLPEGVTIDARNSKTLLTGAETKGHITITAAGNAPPVAAQQCSLMANISLNFVMKATYSSRPLVVSVAAGE